MTTTQIEPDVDAWNEQELRQRRSSRNRRIGTYVVVAAIGVAAVIVVLANRNTGRLTPTDRQQASVSPPPAIESDAVPAADGFVQAFGSFDGKRAVTYLSDSPILRMNATTPEEIPKFVTFLEAMGYEQIVSDGCFVTGTSVTGTGVRCPFKWHAIRSGEIGLGPYPGRWNFEVHDGRITSAELSWRLRDFGREVWEPFRDWVRQTHPADFDAMYVGDGGDFELTRRSTRLWEEHTREYVDAVRAGDAGR